MIVIYKMAWNLWSQTSFHAIKYIQKLVYIYLLSFYISSLTDIEHSPDYIAFGLPQTHEVR